MRFASSLMCNHTAAEKENEAACEKLTSEPGPNSLTLPNLIGRAAVVHVSVEIRPLHSEPGQEPLWSLNRYFTKRGGVPHRCQGSKAATHRCDWRGERRFGTAPFASRLLDHVRSALLFLSSYRSQMLAHLRCPTQQINSSYGRLCAVHHPSRRHLVPHS